MPVINKSMIVPYTTQQMYDLVNDIESYPEFVPWCVEGEILSRNEEEIRANLSFARSGMQKSFSTINRLSSNKMIEIRLLDGPFKQLEGFWRFETVSDAESCVKLDLEFEFSNKILAMMFGPVFHQVASLLVDSFSDRAKTVYGS